MKKVLLYALGEILLVVIGILIAVNINNWNTNRKLDQVEATALSRLTEDLKSDINRYDFLQRRLEERIGRCDSTLLLLENQRTLNDRLGLIAVHQINFFLVESNTTTYDEMLNTGRLYSLKNPVLRQAIIRYYRNVSKWSKYIEKSNGQVRSKMIQAEHNDYWIIQERIWDDKDINIEEFPWLKQRYSRELRDFEALLQTTKEMYGFIRSRSLYLKDECELLLKTIEEERGS